MAASTVPLPRQPPSGRLLVLAACLAAAAGWAGACGAADTAGGPVEVARRGPEVTPPADRAVSSSPSGTAAGSAPASPGDAEAALAVALRRLPAHLDPFEPLDPWGERIAEDLVYEGLVRRADEQAPFADLALADRCVVEPPERSRWVQCHLRPGVRFHDGSEVTMADVAYAFDQWLDPRRAELRRAAGLTGLASAEVVDAAPGGEGRDPGQWIRIGFEHPEAWPLERLAVVRVVPKAAHRGRSTAFRAAPVGTGPMRVVNLDEGVLVLERAPTARRDTGVARFVFQAMPDGAQALTGLRRGAFDILAELSPAYVPDELGRPGMAARFRAFVTFPAVRDLLLYNLRTGVQSGPRLRAALDDALPRGSIGRDVWGGWTRVPGTLVDLENPQELDLPSVEGRQDPGVPRAPSDADDEAGRTRAAAALDELDWKLERGVRQRPTGKLRLTLTWDGSRGAAAAEAKAVQEALRAIGLQVPFTTASWSYLRSGPLASGQFDLALVRMTARTAGDLAPYFHSRGATNLQGVAEAAVDGAFEAYFRATDRTGRLEASRQLDVALREHHVASVLAAPVQVLLLSRRVEQLEFRDDLPRLDVLRLGGEPRGWHR